MNKSLKGGPTGLQAHVSQVVAQARLVSAGLGPEHRHGLHVLSRILACRKGKRGCWSPSHGQPQQSEPTLPAYVVQVSTWNTRSPALLERALCHCLAVACAAATTTTLQQSNIINGDTASWRCTLLPLHGHTCAISISRPLHPTSGEKHWWIHCPGRAKPVNTNTPWHVTGLAPSIPPLRPRQRHTTCCLPVRSACACGPKHKYTFYYDTCHTSPSVQQYSTSVCTYYAPATPLDSLDAPHQQHMSSHLGVPSVGLADVVPSPNSVALTTHPRLGGATPDWVSVKASKLVPSAFCCQQLYPAAKYLRTPTIPNRQLTTRHGVSLPRHPFLPPCRPCGFS
ncbi:hypothetical protein PSV09DRAFT_2262469 [Bipolaris maydis]|uniref:uncharacterized protein n=1 Tax=Cochliobolus heterostrophus TaxID=5016 RepID=UPI0024D7671F|nr:hypothetical protein J3E73DRAFT_255730 [Bipolaris maydis]KAJ5062560.1 hypothetical protein J3E74DRAFT_288267 [Bipolaris maydis]KAJ6204734.1 hypothetical protein PSV09DRAFT_2262469 [Bipolaris maydis]KAJ6266561.1 hypothetical protein PSV08DRAFT_251496 [Bipolaris maydis]